MGTPGPKPRRKEVLWSADFAYAVGLITTDGNLSPDGRHLILVSKDKEQIENIKECLGITANASYKASGSKGNTNLYYRLQWGDITLYTFLLSIGLTPNKSLTLGPLIVPDEYFFDFLRGIFDGDGCFYSYFDPRWKSSFMFYMTFTSASKVHIFWLRETIERFLDIRGHVTTGKQMNSIYNLKYAKKESMIVLNVLYPNKKTRCLKRKRLKIETALSIVGLSLSKEGVNLTK